MTSISAVRSLRNFNPGNLRATTIRWKGLANPDNDGENYAVFVDYEHGLRAMAMDLLNDRYQDGLESLHKLIHEFAPSEDNNHTANYIHYVCDITGIGEHDAVDLHNHETLKQVMYAMCRYEAGREWAHGAAFPFSDAVMTRALTRAGVAPADKPLTKSRTVAGGAVATAALAVEAMQPTMPLLQRWLEVAPLTFSAIAVAGIVWMIYARVDDNRRGLR